jgi:hypothetical protein
MSEKIKENPLIIEESLIRRLNLSWELITNVVTNYEKIINIVWNNGNEFLKFFSNSLYSIGSQSKNFPIRFLEQIKNSIK